MADYKGKRPNSWYAKNLASCQEKSRNYYKTHKELKRLLNKKDKVFNAFRKFTNCCIICFETNPFVLEEHHPFPNSKTKVCLCGNCHNLIHYNCHKKSPALLEFFAFSD